MPHLAGFRLALRVVVTSLPALFDGRDPGTVLDDRMAAIVEADCMVVDVLHLAAVGFLREREPVSVAAGDVGADRPRVEKESEGWG